MASLSRPPQLIGPVYNDLNREARKLKRQGFRGAAQDLAFEASKQKLAGGESGITSEMSNRNERLGLQTIQRGLSRANRDAVMKPEAKPGLTTAATGDLLTKRQGLYERMRGGVTPEMRTEASGLGITDSGFAQASTSAAKSPLTPTTGATPVVAAPTATRPGLTRPATTPQLGVSRPGLIDGKPTSLALKRPADSEPGNMGDIQARDAEERQSVIGAAMAASADATTSRTRKDVVDEANKARIAAGKTPFDDSIYGEMTKVDTERTSIDRNKSRLLGKAQGMLADRAAAGQITAGMNAAPTPTLDTSFPAPSTAAPTPSTPTPTAAATPPVSPAPPQSSAYYAGLGLRKTLGSAKDSLLASMKGPDYSLPENAPVFTNAMVAKPLRFNTLKKPELSEGGKKLLRPAKRGASDFARGLFTGR